MPRCVEKTLFLNVSESWFKTKCYFTLYTEKEDCPFRLRRQHPDCLFRCGKDGNAERPVNPLLEPRHPHSAACENWHSGSKGFALS